MKTVCAAFVGILLCLWAPSRAQIVNVERQRISSTDSVGWFGDAGINFTTARSTVSYLTFGVNTGLQHKGLKSVILLLTDFNLVNAGGEEFANNAFAHLRYNTKVSKVIRWEVFTQIQYNNLTKINMRYLAGTGPRFKLTPYETAKFYWGIAYMFEYEELTDPVLIHQDHRLSSYFSFTLVPVENVSFISTTYIQPLLRDFTDYRLYNENVLTLAITGNLSLDIKFQVSYDAAPPDGVPNVIYKSVNGLTYEF
ncbi:MAG TPA: DUF481 domain-containing protein [Saprospiraceae bacterium]|nr:DUF481 domain-containing protein [Saprospiraceae bacterium]